MKKKNAKIAVSLSCHICGEPATDCVDKSKKDLLDIRFVCENCKKH